jgi:hypothetical protein
VKKLLLLLACGASASASACGKFEDPAIVIDLRPLAMTADPPEQLIPYDPQHPPDPATIQLAPVEICALIADPGAQRQLDFTMTACPPENNDRCDPTKPSVLVGGGTIDDPEDAATPQPACARLDPSADLFAVVRQAAIDDPLQGFSSIDIMVEMRVNPSGATASEAVYGSKGVRFGAEVPAGRTPNHNPTLTEIDWLKQDATTGPLVLGRCHDQASPLEVAPGEELHLAPVEPPGVRETYVVPTFDGGSQQITENLSYAWLAGDGKWKKASTGGPRDPFGNDPPLDTSWTAPTDVGAGLDVPIYVVQRDERLGEAWFESCVHVRP